MSQQLIHPEVIGKPFFPSVKRELMRRRSLNQISFGSEDVSNPHLWQPFFVIRRIRQNFAQDLGVKPNEYITGRFSEIGKVRNPENSYDIGEGIRDVVAKGGEYRQSAGITQVNIEQDGFTFFTTTINFVIPDIADFEDFRKMWFIHSAPCEMEFGRIVPIMMNTTDTDASPFIMKMNGHIATFSYQAGNSGRSITGEMKIYSATNMFPAWEAMATNKNKTEFQGQVMDRIKGDTILYGEKTESDQRSLSSMRTLMEGRTRRTDAEIQGDFDDLMRVINNPTSTNEPQIFPTRPPVPVGLGAMTAQKESGFNSSAVSPEFNGQRAYGTFQFQHGNAKKFIDSTPYKDEFTGLSPSSDDFTEKWKEVSKREGDKFTQYEYEYATKVFYEPAKKNAEARGINTTDRGIQEFLFSMGINHSTSGQNKIMDEAIKKSAGDPNTTDFIDHLRDARIEYVDGLSPTTEGGSLKEQLKERYGKEAEIAKKLSNGEDLAFDRENLRSTDPVPRNIDLNDSNFRSDTRALIDTRDAELIYVPVNETTNRDKNLELSQLKANSGAFVDDAGDKREDTRHGTQPMPDSHVLVKDLENVKGNLAEVIKATIATFKLDSNVFGTDLYHYISVYALEKIMNDYFVLLYESDVAPLIRFDLSSVKIRDMKNLGLVMTSIYPETILFNPHELEGEENENTLKTVYISAQYIYDLTVEREIASPFLFVEAIMDKITESTSGLVNLQKINKVTINKEDGFYDTNVITYIDQSIVVDSFTNENDSYYEFDLFTAKEKVKNPSVQTEMSDIFSQLAFASHYGKYPTRNNIVVDQKNIAGGLPTLTILREGGAIQSPVEADEQTRESSESRNMINDLQNNEEGAHRRKIPEQILDLGRGHIEDILSRSSSTYSQDAQIQAEYQSTISRYYATLHYIFDLTLQQMHLNADQDPQTAIPLPLKYTFTLDGIAGIVQGQCFRISPTAFPMSFSIGGEHDYYTYIVMAVNHEFTGNMWDTTINGMLYVSKAGVSSMRSPQTQDELNTLKASVDQEKTNAIMNNLVPSRVNPVTLEIPFTQPSKADMSKYKIDESVKQKQTLVDKLKNSINQAKQVYATGTESLEYHQNKLNQLQSQLDEATADLNTLKAVKNQIDEGINDLDTYIQNKTDEALSGGLPSANTFIQESLKNGILEPLKGVGDTSITSKLDNVTSKAGSISNLAESLSNGVSSSFGSTIDGAGQAQKLEAFNQGLKSVEAQSNAIKNTLSTQGGSLPNSETVKQASLLTSQMTQELVGLKNLAPSLGLTQVPVGGEFKSPTEVLETMIMEAKSTKASLDQTTTVLDPQTGKLVLDNPISMDLYKTGDLSTVPDGFIAGVQNQQYLKQNKISFNKAKKILSAPY